MLNTVSHYILTIDQYQPHIAFYTDFAMHNFLFKLFLASYFFLNLTHLVRSCKQYQTVKFHLINLFH